MNKVPLPVDSAQFSCFIDTSQIFAETRKNMKGYLTNWYNDTPDLFVEDMRADLPFVLARYHFYDEFVSITKNYNFDPPMDTVSCTIRITDEEDVCCTRYIAFYDAQLNCIDDKMSG